MRLGVEAALVDGRLVPGDVALAGDRIEAVGLDGPNGRGIALARLMSFRTLSYEGSGNIVRATLRAAVRRTPS